MRLLSIAIVTLATATALAKSNTEFYYQPAAGQNALQVGYDMDNKPGSVQAANGGATTDLKEATNDLGLKYEYGLSETQTLGIYAFYGSDKRTNGSQTFTANGLGDIHGYWEAMSDMWHYGVNLGVNTSKIEYDTATNLQDNRTTGGLSLYAHVGMLVASGPMNYGGDLRYTYLGDRTADVTPNQKSTGGGLARVDAFTEWNYGMGFLGADLSYNMVMDNTVKTDGASDVTLKGENYLNLNINGSYDFNDSWTALATIGVAMHNSHDQLGTSPTPSVQSYTETNFLIAARYTF